jgi:hypothetical protein
MASISSNDFLGLSSHLILVFTQILSLAKDHDSETAFQKGNDLVRVFTLTLACIENHSAEFVGMFRATLPTMLLQSTPYMIGLTTVLPSFSYTIEFSNNPLIYWRYKTSSKTSLSICLA